MKDSKTKKLTKAIKELPEELIGDFIDEKDSDDVHEMYFEFGSVMIHKKEKTVQVLFDIDEFPDDASLLTLYLFELTMKNNFSFNTPGCFYVDEDGEVLFDDAAKEMISECREDLFPDIELVAAKVHEDWIKTKQSQGATSLKSEDGEELMVPYDQLSEKAKDLDRNTVRAVYGAIENVTLSELIEEEI